MNDDHLISSPPTEATEGFSDALSDLIRRGARQIIQTLGFYAAGNVHRIPQRS